MHVESVTIDSFISALQYGDTAKFLASALYQIIDDNPIAFEQWSASANRSVGAPPLPWHYKANPDHARIALQNHIGQIFSDSARAGYILACDYIADVLVLDTAIKYRPFSSVTPDMVLVTSSILDPIKGKQVPGCPLQYSSKSGSLKRAQSDGDTSFAQVYPCVPTPAVSGACLNFEYSPEWQKGIFSDNVKASGLLKDATGWWIKPNGEYIVFLFLQGNGRDTSKYYFTVHPFWGVFGTSGAMYPVVNGIVVDPNDDFGLGSTNLTVADWKSRLRARISTIIAH
jgi:hypothetical protein